MVKTIKQLADELKVSKQTIQYHYQRLPAKNKQKNSQGTNLISPMAERIIRDKVAKPLLAKEQQIGSKESPKTSKENNELITTLRREIDDLKSQRDKQLATKDRQIDHLTKLIDQQQQLQLATVTENHQLKEHVRKLSFLLEASNSGKEQQVNDKEENKRNTINNDNEIENQGKKDADEFGNKQNEIHKNIFSKNWWHFW